jgi:hypothetical protein
VVVVCLWLWGRDFRNHRAGGELAGPISATGRSPGANARSAPPPIEPQNEPVHINIACGFERQKWLESAYQEFRGTPAGGASRIHVYGMSSEAAVQAIIAGVGSPAASDAVTIHVWSPASSIHRAVLEQEWRRTHAGSPILRAEDLAVTPLVFVIWKQRRDAFLQKYAKIDFQNLGAAIREPGGWKTIAGKDEWGLFKFGHADPHQSDNGLQMLFLMAGEFSGKPGGPGLEDIHGRPFQSWLRGFELGVPRSGSGLPASAAKLAEELVLRGPSQYDCLFLDENLAIESMHAAVQRWGEQGEIAIAYPNPSTENRQPYYILDVPWSTDRQRKAAAVFLEFLRSEPIQRGALAHGIRPPGPLSPQDASGSPLVRRASSGLRIDQPPVYDPPPADVVKALLDAFPPN